MEIVDQELERLVLTRVVRLNAVLQGIVLGMLFGLTILIATLWLVIKGGPVVGPHLGLLSQFFIGYEVSFAGSLIGFAYGFVVGFVIGSSVAKIYNLVADWRARMMPAARQAVELAVHSPASARSTLNSQGTALNSPSGKESAG